MKQGKFFNDLIVLDLANNHFGDLEHSKKIINNFAKIIKKYKIKSTIKFQFRQLPEFVHKNFRSSDLKYVRRFLDTKLSDAAFIELFNLIKKNKILTSCTPFDEASIEKIEKLKFDIIKVASVSALDFNLHQRLVKNKIPKIISTGGINLFDIDKIVSFYSKKNQQFALMHCVSIYPTSNEKLNLKFIRNIKKRYKNIPIGWSTHEDPGEFLPAALALSNGATIFEKHVGINSKKYKLNNYSIEPKNFERWYLSLQKAKQMLGNGNSKEIYPQEIDTINNLSRGVYAKRDLKKNEILNDKNTYFAIPLKKGQLSSQDLKKDTKILSNIKKDFAINTNKLRFNKKLILEYKVKSYLHKAKAMLNYNNINLGDNFDLEISHHKGIDNFEKIGCFLFNIVNRKYAKKLIVMLPNQKHPSHYHKKKTETFIMLAGNLTLIDNNKTYFLSPGDKVDLMAKSYHKFTAGNEGCIFEEISTTSIKSDSYYQNHKIKKLDRNSRKTYVNNWFEINPEKVKY